MKYTLLLVTFGIFFLALSFGRVEPVVLTSSSPFACAWLGTHQPYWILVHEDRSVGAFRVLADDEDWIEHKGGRPIGSRMWRDIILGVHLETKIKQCFELEILEKDTTPPEIRIMGIGGHIPTSQQNFWARCLSVFCTTMAGLFVLLNRRRIRP